MASCQNCSQPWSWGEVMKKSITIYTYMICPHCRKKQYPATRTRKISSGLVLFYIATVTVSTLYIDSIIAVFASYILVLALHTFAFPFYLELRNKEETLF